MNLSLIEINMIVFFCISFILLFFSVKIIKQNERAVTERLGKYDKYLQPGFHLIIPFIDIIKRTDIRSQTLDIPPQSVITQDNVEIKVDGIIWARPYDKEESVKKTFYAIDNWIKAIQELSQTNLRQEFGALTLDESLISRQKISGNLEKELDKITDEWGIKVDKVEIKLIDPPNDIKNAMHMQKTAEQTRRAMKLEATGKFEAAQQEKLAAIEKADGEKQSKIKIAEGEAEAIKIVNEAAEKYFKGSAKELKQLQTMERSLKNNSKIIITQEGIKPNIILGEIPLTK